MLTFQIVGFIGMALFLASLVSGHTAIPTR
jgi:hypothetical protein